MERNSGPGSTFESRNQLRSRSRARCPSMDSGSRLLGGCLGSTVQFYGRGGTGLSRRRVFTSLLSTSARACILRRQSSSRMGFRRRSGTRTLSRISGAHFSGKRSSFSSRVVFPFIFGRLRSRFSGSSHGLIGTVLVVSTVSGNAVLHCLLQVVT